jgi:hypothetical protein
VFGDERLLAIDDIISTSVGRILCFDIRVLDNGSISSSAANLKAKKSISKLTEDDPESNIHILGHRIPDGVVKGEAQGRVCVFTAFAAVEQILLDVLENREENTACLVGSDAPIWAANTADERSCKDSHGPHCRQSKER